ncbi:hypothetical protein NMG46_12785 [Mesorhizobium sp. LMG 17147]|uniref:hypothetical protein n=1 Tax=Mesorhizobium sp. LMG 17147 TaxID=2963091 RepID=UPI0020C9D930|nr:hypothetical protein [Mesorhizobium sp. LMG 17147]MCP9231119.1 hypothetical protein [Mesorhizobium sp. LMG 17147]
MRDMSVAPVIDKRTVEAARASTRPGGIAPTAEPKSDTATTIGLFDYTEKAFVVRGDTVDFKEKLRELGGKWISTKDGSKAWMFSKRRLKQVATLLRVAAKLHPAE